MSFVCPDFAVKYRFLAIDGLAPVTGAFFGPAPFSVRHLFRSGTFFDPAPFSVRHLFRACTFVRAGPYFGPAPISGRHLFRAGSFFGPALIVFGFYI